MNNLWSITSNLRRFRNRCGFGVHSPLAFKLMKEIFSNDNKYGYYGDTYIIHSADTHYHKAAKQHLMAIRGKRLLRLSATLRVKTVLWLDDASEMPVPYLTALKTSYSSITILSASRSEINFPAPSGEASDIKTMALLPCDNNAIDAVRLDYLKTLLKERNVCLMLSDFVASDVAKLYDGLDHGLLLEGKRDAFLFSRPNLMKRRYLF